MSNRTSLFKQYTFQRDVFYIQSIKNQNSHFSDWKNWNKSGKKCAKIVEKIAKKIGENCGKIVEKIKETNCGKIAEKVCKKIVQNILEKNQGKLCKI